MNRPNQETGNAKRTEIRWGIIGCGEVTELKSGPGFQKAVGSRLVAVMRRNAELAADYARRHNVPRWYSDASALINDNEVDAVYIATPPSSHAELAMQCAQAGKPCYVEKPMAMNHAQSQALVQAFAQADIPLFSAYYRRAMPRFQKIRSLLAENAIGSVRHVSISLYQPMPAGDASEDQRPWRLNPEIAGGGRFVDMASHQLDFMDYLFGPITDINGYSACQSGKLEVEDTVCASFRFESGILGAGTWCFAAGLSEDRSTIVGDAGRLEFSTFDATPVRLVTSAGEQVFDIPNPEHVQQPLIQSVVNTLLGYGICPSTGENAARTDAVIDRILGRA